MNIRIVSFARPWLVVPLLVLCGVAGRANAYPAAVPDSTELTAAGLRSMLLYSPSDTGEAASPVVQAGKRRSVPLALGMSALVPGLGQAYNRQWVKTAVAVVLEAVLVFAYVDSRRKGLDEEAAYIEYAHRYWSPVQYSMWLEDYSEWLADPNFGRMEIDQTLIDGIDLQQPDTWTPDMRRQVNAFFDQIHAVESVAYHPHNRASFSHKLPYFGEQQYYELIGKYYQFAPGWEDYGPWRDGNTFTETIDPTVKVNNVPIYVSDRFWEYDDMAEHANDLLRRASRMTALLLVNHVASAIDAAVFAKLHNDRLDTQLTMAYDPGGTLRPHATVRVRF